MEFAALVCHNFTNMGKLSELLHLDLSKNVLEHASTYLFSVLKGHNITVDEDRNIYVTKGKAAYPAFVASIDSDYTDSVNIERIIKNVWVGYELWTGADGTEDVRPTEYAAGTKTAMYLALKLLDKLDSAKCVFKFNNNLNKLFFEDCRWALELNGRGNEEVLTSRYGTPQCSTSFTTMVKTIGKKYGYDTMNYGMPTLSDMQLPISTVLIPNGHYAPIAAFHEVVEADVTKALNFCVDMATKIQSICLLDEGCKACNKRLTSSETHYCYMCLNNLRKSSTRCKVCSGTLYQANEFFIQTCKLCKKPA
jgi:hypothetical protein